MSADRPLILSIFPGIDMLGRALEAEWPEACLVRGPDLLWGGDVRTFHPPAGVFDGVIGGPPCQAFSRLRHLVKANGHPAAENLIPEFERVVAEAAPEWFLMENVPEAPAPAVFPWGVQRVEIMDAWVGGETRRRRAFFFGCIIFKTPGRFEVETLALHRADPEPPVLASGGARPIPVAIGGSGQRKRTLRDIETRKGASAMGFKTTAYYRDACRLQGLPPDFLEHAPFTVAGKIHAVGNGVPMAMGRAIARAVKRALDSAPGGRDVT